MGREVETLLIIRVRIVVILYNNIKINVDNNSKSII